MNLKIFASLSVSNELKSINCTQALLSYTYSCTCTYLLVVSVGEVVPAGMQDKEAVDHGEEDSLAVGTPPSSVDAD